MRALVSNTQLVEKHGRREGEHGEDEGGREREGTERVRVGWWPRRL